MKKMSSDLIMEHISLSEYSSFENLYNEHAAALLKIAIKKTGNKDLAMDIVQDLFVDLWQRRFQISIKTSPHNFLVSSLYYKVFQYFRKEGVTKKHIEQFTILHSVEQPVIEGFRVDDIEQSYQDMMGCIHESVDQMPLRMREIFRLKYYRSYSNQEIAESLGISNQTVKNQLSRSLDHLRRELGDKMVYEPICVISILSFVLLNS